MFENVDRGTDGRRRDGRRGDWYTISSPMSLQLRWANNNRCLVLSTSEHYDILFNAKVNVMCLVDIKLKETHGNWKCVDIDLKIMYTLFILHVSLSLVTLFILSRGFFLAVWKSKDDQSTLFIQEPHTNPISIRNQSVVNHFANPGLSKVGSKLLKSFLRQQNTIANI